MSALTWLRQPGVFLIFHEIERRHARKDEIYLNTHHIWHINNQTLLVGTSKWSSWLATQLTSYLPPRLLPTAQ